MKRREARERDEADARDRAEARTEGLLAQLKAQEAARKTPVASPVPAETTPEEPTAEAEPPVSEASVPSEGDPA